MKTEIDNLIALTNDKRIEASLRKLALQELSRIQDEIKELEKQSKNIDALHGVSNKCLHTPNLNGICFKCGEPIGSAPK